MTQGESPADATSLLAALEGELARVELSPLARARAVRELARVRHRLVAGDYELSGFGTNALDVPDRSAELLAELEFLAALGRDWACVLTAAGVVSARRIVEVGPGFVPKVQLGLVYAGYQGELHVLDKDAASFAHLQRYLALFRPGMRLVHVHDDLTEAKRATYEAVLANHLFDDLALDEHARLTGQSLATFYGSEEALCEAWEAIAAGRSVRVELLAARAADGLAALAGPGAVLVLAQYPSYMERRLELATSMRLSMELMESAVGHLERRGFARIEGCASGLRAAGALLAESHFRLLRAPSTSGGS